MTFKEFCIRTTLLLNAVVGYLNGDKAPKIVKLAGIKSIDYKMTIYAANPTWLREALDCGTETACLQDFH